MVGVGFRGKEAIGLKSQRLNLWDALTTLNHLHNYDKTYSGEQHENLDRIPGEEDDIVDFVACGKNELLDADMNYSLDQETNAKKDTSTNPKEEEKTSEGDPDVKGIIGQKRSYKYIEPI